MSGTLDRFSDKFKRAMVETKLTLRIPKHIMGIGKVINKPSYYPEMQRKSKGKMRRENIRWIFRHKELNTFYTSYGLDVKDYRDPDDFISHRDFCVMRNTGNQALIRSYTGNYNYIVALRDKYIFAAYLASTLGKDSVVNTQALICHGKAYDHSTKEWMSIEQFLSANRGPRAFKVIDGECAEGVMLVEIGEGSVTVDGASCSYEEFAREHGTKRMIVQNVIEQHEALRAFGTKCVNTIRAVTIQGKSGKISVFSAFLRLGATKDSFVDNRAKGGLGVGIDLETGKLQKYGFPHDQFGVKQEEHPLSGVKFDGYQLPYWKEVVELICAAHSQFYEIQSIGWDVVLTPDGPVLLEGNDDWEIGGPQDTSGGLKKRWQEQVNA